MSLGQSHSKMEMMPVFSSVKNFEQFNNSLAECNYTNEYILLILNDNYANSHKSRC